MRSPSISALSSSLALLARTLPLAVVVLLLQSLFWTDRVPTPLKLAVGTVGLLAVRRPAEALVVVVGLAPFTHVLTTRIWTVHPVALAEALVLAWFVGYLVWDWRHRATVPRLDALTRPARLFGLVVLAACATQGAVLAAWHDYPLAYLRRFLAYLARDYLTTVPDPRPWVEGQGFAITAAPLVEGAALVVAVARLCRAEPAIASRATAMAAVAGVGVAIVNLLGVVEAFMRGEVVFGDLWIGDRRHQWTVFIPSLNTSGSYLLLATFAALGAAPAWRRLPPVCAAFPALLAMWFTKTFSAFVATGAAVAAGLTWRGIARSLPVSGTRALLTVSVASIVSGIGLVAVLPERAYRSLYLRGLFAETAMRMWSAYPLFGIGLAQYELRFREFSSPELLSNYNLANAHNTFLWVAAELGLTGLFAFLWLVGAALLQGWRRVRATPEDPGPMWLFIGLGGFIVTWLGGQPLVVPLVAYTFWILLGVAAGAAPPLSTPAAGPIGPTKWAGYRRIAVSAFVIFVAASVPVRVHNATEQIDFARVTYGFANWEAEADGTRYRWTGPRATFFLPADVRAVELPLRAFPPTEVGVDEFEVRILVDRRLASTVLLRDGDWHFVRVPGPPPERRGRFWRVDLEVRPWWRPADRLPDSTDRRRLGVKVGEIVPLRP